MKILMKVKKVYSMNINDRIFTIDGKYLEVRNIEKQFHKIPINVYNLTVEKNHTYFITKSSLLVHNVVCPD